MALWHTLYVSHDVSPKDSLNEAKYLTSDNLIGLWLSSPIWEVVFVTALSGQGNLGNLLPPRELHTAR